MAADAGWRAQVYRYRAVLTLTTLGYGDIAPAPAGIFTGGLSRVRDTDDVTGRVSGRRPREGCAGDARRRRFCGARRPPRAPLEG